MLRGSDKPDKSADLKSSLPDFQRQGYKKEGGLLNKSWATNRFWSEIYFNFEGKRRLKTFTTMQAKVVSVFIRILKMFYI